MGGTGLEVKVIAGRGASLSADVATATVGDACVAVRSVGNITDKTTTTLGLVSAPAAVLSTGDTCAMVPVQVQLRYTRPNGDQVLQVLTSRLPSSTSPAHLDVSVVAARYAFFAPPASLPLFHRAG